MEEGSAQAERLATSKPISEDEVGSCEEFRFITSPELTAYANSGASVGSTGLVSTGASTVDVYPFMVMGEDAVFDVDLRGMNSFSMTHLPHNKPDKSDPLSQRGYVGCTFWTAVLIANGGWMGVIEAGVTTQT